MNKSVFLKCSLEKFQKVKEECWPCGLLSHSLAAVCAEGTLYCMWEMWDIYSATQCAKCNNLASVLLRLLCYIIISLNDMVMIAFWPFVDESWDIKQQTSRLWIWRGSVGLLWQSVMAIIHHLQKPGLVSMFQNLFVAPIDNNPVEWTNNVWLNV